MGLFYEKICFRGFGRKNKAKSSLPSYRKQVWPGQPPLQQPPTADEPLSQSKKEEKLHDIKCDKSKATRSILSNEMIAKQESTLSNVQQNKYKTDTS